MSQSPAARTIRTSLRAPRLAVPAALLALLSALVFFAAPELALAANAPTVSDVAPSTGATAGGDVVTITGTNFVAGAAVTFNGVPATNVSVDSATTITATTPPGSLGFATIIVTNTDGQGASLGNAFRYVGPPPVITGIDPANGTSAGGTVVKILGSGFLQNPTVHFGDTAATTVTWISAGEVRATTPPSPAGAVSVRLTNVEDGQSSTIAGGFTYIAAAPPTISSISPSSGTTGGGTVVTITGTGFVTGATVRFGGSGGTLATNVTVTGPTQIRATTPARSAGPTHLHVANPDAQSAQLNNAFTYVNMPAPTVTSVTPNAGQTAGGNTVTITGTGFLAGATVAFGNNNASGVTVVSGTQITAVVPAATSTGSVGVKVTNTDGKNHTLSNGYTYSSGPTVTSISPSSGTTGGGTPVTITGTGFVTGATVRFGGSNGPLATSVNVVNSTTITALTPARSTGAVDVRVANPNNQFGTLTNGYTYVSTPAPSVTGVSPSNGPTSGGNTVTVTGTGFLPGAKVAFGAKDATGVTVINSTTLTAVVPSGTAGATVAVKVTNTDGKNHTRNNAYSYSGPSITSVSPATGTSGGGTPVTITGVGFLAGATVTFGGAPATGVTVVSSTQITAVTPARPLGAVTVQVTNTNGQVGHLNNAYTYISTPAPSISGVSPVQGVVAGGTVVTITGTGFLPGATVTFGSNNATSVLVTSASQLTAVTPSATSSGMVNVRVTNTDGKSDTRVNAYTYIAGPSISSISPSSGPTVGGTQVTITGSGFTPGMTVTIGGKAATSVDVVSATTITARVPAGVAGAAAVEVRTAQGGLAVGSAVFTYTVTAGTIVNGSIPSQGVGLFVFSGGDSSQLTALAVAAGCPATNIGFYATVGGQFIVFLPGAPAFVNNAWHTHFANGVPANTPLLASCRQ